MYWERWYSTTPLWLRSPLGWTRRQATQPRKVHWIQFSFFTFFRKLVWVSTKQFGLPLVFQLFCILWSDGWVGERLKLLLHLLTVVFFVGASVFRIADNETLLTVINSQCSHANGTVVLPSFCPHTFGKLWQILSRVLVYLFPAVVLMSGIPVFSIIVRYNLISTNLCGKSNT